MPDDRDEETARRSVVPPAAGRSLWLAAAWTGAGAAFVCATVAIVVVAICWLPVSGTSGRTNSSIRAGLLSFLASVHGGITVDGTAAAFLPLGLLLAVALTAWRAGSGLADAADALDERDPTRLVLAGGAQAVSFTVMCLIALPFSTLGTSSVPFLGVGAGALILFAATGGTAFVRSSALRDWGLSRLPSLAVDASRAAAAVVAVYLGAGALLVAGSLVLHHSRVEALSRQVGGGWGGVPVLLLGVLAAPNAVIAGSSYLAGPGFSFGTGTSATVVSTAHGTLPAFPILGAMPGGHGASPLVWFLVVSTPLVAGVVLTRLVVRAETWTERFRTAGAAGLGAGLIMVILGWQGGGAIGEDRLQTVGASPWQLGLAVALESAAVASVALGLALGWQRWHGPNELVATGGTSPGRAAAIARLVAVAREVDHTDQPGKDADKPGKLAG